jgi:hypothetical protein
MTGFVGAKAPGHLGRGDREFVRQADQPNVDFGNFSDEVWAERDALCGGDRGCAPIAAMQGFGAGGSAVSGLGRVGFLGLARMRCGGRGRGGIDTCRVAH